ncbi:hypothetical protein EON81_20815, partial [bacterium]
LNGLGANETPPAGTKLSVIVGIDADQLQKEQNSRYSFKGVYEVRPGETLNSLAETWGVEADDIVAANPSMTPGAEPQEGDLLNLIVLKDGVKTKAAELPPVPEEDKSMAGNTAVTLEKCEIRASSDAQGTVVGSVDKGSYVEILGLIKATNRYRIRYNELMGFADAGKLRLRDTTPAPPAPDPSTDLVAREALKYVGTPYRWGGNSLTQGIDCSHYVAQIFSRIGWKAPSPPVVIQETIGTMVHCKSGPARRSGKALKLPNVSQFPSAATTMKSLRPGDRIIFQRGGNDASGSRHTGIYIGQVPSSWRAKFGNIPYAFAHASSSRGITVGSLTNRYYWNLYKYSVRDGGKR